MKEQKTINTATATALAADMKVALLATVDEHKLPHVTLITTIQARDPYTIIWGQFTEGESKRNVHADPQTAFLVMSLTRRIWRGRALWKEERKEGAEYEMYNNKPMWRYNTYFGIHTVHYMQLVGITDGEPLPMAQVVQGGLATRMARGGVATGRQERILSPWAESMLGKLDSLKFVCYVGDDGFPVIIPCIQAQAADSRRIAVSPLPYGDELKAIPDGTEVALFGMTLDMEDILLRGTWTGFRAHGLARLATIDIDWVYNSMPPVMGQIYPPIPLEPVTQFE
ncbi:MAG: pyridoxamine 5'-phosphate oxidase family protein [Candidatus Cryosericum sp.]